MRSADSFRRFSGHLVSAAVGLGLLLTAGVARGQDVTEKPWPPNLKPAKVLSQLDIDGDGAADQSPDSDRDGLPDNWEIGGTEPLAADGTRPDDRLVRIPAPTAVSPGLLPTVIFARRAVATEANNWDTDGDGLSDFVEVFGLKFIDDNGNGILDYGIEWFDANEDGLPSVGEYPLPNINLELHRDHDYDGFVFTDPTNPDTDGDGLLDGEDPDPLINPRAFNVQGFFFERPETRNDPEGDRDLDNDGLGNGTDFGNEVIRQVDYPPDLPNLLEIFREDLLAVQAVPESAMEDLLAVDWDGNGLFALTDVRDWTPIVQASRIRRLIDPGHTDADLRAGRNPFYIELADGTLHQLFREQDIKQIRDAWPLPELPWSDSRSTRSYGRVQDEPADVGLGLGYQQALKPAKPEEPFLPDLRIFGILYAWRMPGFDIDGDGFVGAPSAAKGFTAPYFDETLDAEQAGQVSIILVDGQPQENRPFPQAEQVEPFQAFDDWLPILPESPLAVDGRIEADRLVGVLSACPLLGFGALFALAVGLVVTPRRRR